MSPYYDNLLFWLDTLSEREWFILLLGVLIVGAMCLRGFGSRKNY
jgi:hypothetical protein